MTVIKEWNGSQWVPIVVGKQGPSATVGVGSTTTLSSGSPATVANSGTSSAAVFDFGIPQGIQGIPGVVVYDDDQNILAHQVFS